MDYEKKKLIEDFIGCERINSNYERNWVDLMFIAELISKNLCHLDHNLTTHEIILLKDTKQYINNAILTFDKTKIFECIVDFINTYNIIQPFK